jgi:hypothetical protein
MICKDQNWFGLNILTAFTKCTLWLSKPDIQDRPTAFSWSYTDDTVTTGHVAQSDIYFYGLH